MSNLLNIDCPRKGSFLCVVALELWYVSNELVWSRLRRFHGGADLPEHYACHSRYNMRLPVGDETPVR